MRIVIADTGNIWSQDNHFLERLKNIILIVCLNGRKVSNKYQCFVSPYRQEEIETDNYCAEDQRLRALASVAGELNSKLGYRDDIVFLSDNEPSTLYPYYVIKDLNEYNRIHLVTMSPWKFERNRRIDEYNQMLSNLRTLDSILYYDSENVLDAIGQQGTIAEAFDFARDYLGELMPKFLNGIYEMKHRPCFFDFASMTYIPLKSGFDKIDLKKRDKEENMIRFPTYRKYDMLGMVCCPPSYPEDTDHVKEKVERPAARIDGKKVCNVLREQRIRLAVANDIPFKSEECPSIGACAGTCEKCDMESTYLRKQLQKIPENQRVYPKFDPAEEVL